MDESSSNSNGGEYSDEEKEERKGLKRPLSTSAAPAPKIKKKKCKDGADTKVSKLLQRKQLQQELIRKQQQKLQEKLAQESENDEDIVDAQNDRLQSTNFNSPYDDKKDYSLPSNDSDVNQSNIDICNNNECNPRPLAPDESSLSGMNDASEQNSLCASEASLQSQEIFNTNTLISNAISNSAPQTMSNYDESFTENLNILQPDSSEQSNGDQLSTVVPDQINMPVSEQLSLPGDDTLDGVASEPVEQAANGSLDEAVSKQGDQGLSDNLSPIAPQQHSSDLAADCAPEQAEVGAQGSAETSEAAEQVLDVAAGDEKSQDARLSSFEAQENSNSASFMNEEEFMSESFDGQTDSSMMQYDGDESYQMNELEKDSGGEAVEANIVREQSETDADKSVDMENQNVQESSRPGGKESAEGDSDESSSNIKKKKKKLSKTASSSKQTADSDSNQSDNSSDEGSLCISFVKKICISQIISISDMLYLF